MIKKAVPSIGTSNSLVKLKVAGTKSAQESSTQRNEETRRVEEIGCTRISLGRKGSTRSRRSNFAGSKSIFPYICKTSTSKRRSKTVSRPATVTMKETTRRRPRFLKTSSAPTIRLTGNNRTPQRSHRVIPRPRA